MPARILPALAGLLTAGALLASLAGCSANGPVAAASHPAQPATGRAGAATAAATAAIIAVARLGSAGPPGNGTATRQFAGP